MIHFPILNRNLEDVINKQEKNGWLTKPFKGLIYRWNKQTQLIRGLYYVWKQFQCAISSKYGHKVLQKLIGNLVYRDQLGCPYSKCESTTKSISF